MTETLLIVGVAAAVVFVAVLFIEGALRPGYDSTYHTGSELSLGDRGWIQIANFLQMGVGMFAFAVGVYRTLNTPVGAVLLAIFGLGMIAAGVFLPDPVRGYPPEAPTGTPDEVSWHHQVHGVIGGVGRAAGRRLELLPQRSYVPVGRPRVEVRRDVPGVAQQLL